MGREERDELEELELDGALPGHDEETLELLEELALAEEDEDGISLELEDVPDEDELLDEGGEPLQLPTALLSFHSLGTQTTAR